MKRKQRAGPTDKFSEILDKALQHWGKSRGADYTVFDGIVAMRLRIVENEAQRYVEEQSRCYRLNRIVTDSDRQEAVWRIIKSGIDSLRPLPTELPETVFQELEHLGQSDWPKAMVVPPECYHYVILTLCYSLKSKNNKEIADVLNMAERTLAKNRSTAVNRLAERILDWETANLEHSASSMTLDPQRVTLHQIADQSPPHA